MTYDSSADTAKRVKAIFDANCISCHNAGTGGTGPSNTDFRSYNGNLGGVLAHADHIDELAGANPNGSVINSAMPKNAGLPLADRQKLSCWFAASAPQ
jgi:mono/diheme cytochrome c family protein